MDFTRNYKQRFDVPTDDNNDNDKSSDQRTHKKCMLCLPDDGSNFIFFFFGSLRSFSIRPDRSWYTYLYVECEHAVCTRATLSCVCLCVFMESNKITKWSAQEKNMARDCNEMIFDGGKEDDSSISIFSKSISENCKKKTVMLATACHCLPPLITRVWCAIVFESECNDYCISSRFSYTHEMSAFVLALHF